MDVFVPHSLEEALEVRFAHPEATPVAGGTDLMVDVNARRVRLRAMLDLSRVDELRSWRREDGRVFMGAGMTFARIARELGEFRPFAEAAHSFASRQIRNQATIGGNLATASPAGDGVSVLAAYGADVVVASARAGKRRVPLGEFLVGPKLTSLGPDELILGVEWEPVAGPGSFAKIGRRGAMVVAVASVCLQVDENHHRVRLALGSVGPTVLRARRTEELAHSLDWRDPFNVTELGRLAATEARPIDDPRGTALYRLHAVEVLARRALAKAVEGQC